MPIATGVFKSVAIKRQTGLGVMAPAGAAGSARYLRRVSSTLDLAKATYTSAEILESQQRRDMRHGVRSVAGSISGELSVGGYQQPLESVLRAGAIAGSTTGSQTTIAATTDGAATPTGTITRSAGSFITDGFRVGDVIRATAGLGANLNKNLIIVAITATVLTVRTLNGTALVAVAAGTAATVAVVGRKITTPATGHARDYYTIEHFFADVPTSERFTDCVFTGATIGLPATGMATVELPIMGLNASYDPAQYFVSPAASATGAVVAAVNGVIVVGGVVVADVTGLTITIAGNHSAPGGVVGSNTDPDIFPGVLEVSGSLTALFRSTALRDMFRDETEGSIAVALTGDNTDSASFVAVSLPRVKLGGNTKDDSPTGLSQTVPFTALENTVTAGGLNSGTISIQDSAFV